MSSSKPCDEDALPPSRSHILAQELQRVQQRTEQRKISITRMQAELRRLQEETHDALRHESRVIAESRREQASLADTAKDLQLRHADMNQRFQERLSCVDRRDDAENHWLQELAAMEHSQNTALDQCAEVDKEVSRWRKACGEQSNRFKHAEAKSKSLELRRKEQRAVAEKIRSQAVDSLEEGQRTRNEVQALRKQSNRLDLDVVKQRNQWQAACGVLLLLLLLLIFGG